MKIFYQKNKKFNFVSVGRNGKLWTHCELVLEKKIISILKRLFNNSIRDINILELVNILRNRLKKYEKY